MFYFKSALRYNARMKQGTLLKFFLLLPLLLTAIFLAVGIVNYRHDQARRTPLSDALQTDAVTRQVAKILEIKCLDCHSSKGSLPFYAGLPWIKGMISEHIEEGMDEFDLDTEFFGRAPGNYSDRTLHHIEEVVEENSMPLVSYRAFHWGSSLTAGEQAMLLSWISQQKNQA